jgi:uncharacterized protein involved in tolerance to divalent cations
MKPVIWILVSTTSAKEAEKIGRAVLKTRLAASFGVYPRLMSVYFWPPGKNQLEQTKGPLLVLETLPKNYAKVSSAVRKLHSDEVPFIGKIKIDGVGQEFFSWMRREIKI